MNRFRFAITLVAVLIALVARPVAAQDHEHSPHLDLTQTLHLDTAQENKLREIYAKYQKPKDDLRARVREHRVAIVKEMSGPTPDRNAIEQHLQEVIRLEGERQRVMVDEYFEILAVLTPAQKKTFSEQMVKHITTEH
jgi:Spy/CpxP family protein refolding chaperone